MPFLTTAATVLLLASADGNVEWAGVSHVPWQDRRPLCPVDGQTFDVRFQTWHNDLTAARVNVNTGSAVFVAAAVVEQRGPYDVWSATVPATGSTTLSYWIELTDGADVDYLSVNGLTDGVPADGGFVVDYSTLSHAPLGATLLSGGGAVFRVWAPGATTAHVRGEFNGWTTANSMTKTGEYFTRRITNALDLHQYKYFFNNSIWRPDARARNLDDGGPYNSVVENPFRYAWTVPDFDTPPLEDMVVYQLHLGTFSGRNDPLGTPPFPGGYADVTARVGHLADLGVNAVMLCPITEFPGDESAGYNPITQWSPEWVYGTPDEFKQMVDVLHQNGIAVLLDIVWNHFSSTDNHLWFYDGTQRYFDSPAIGTPWGDQADFDSGPVRDYFLGSALHWLEEYKVDGFRMDATEYMNIGAQEAAGWSLMQDFNNLIDRRFANKVVIAEQLPDDSWVTRSTASGGAGFDSQYFDAFTDRLREELLDSAFGDPEIWKVREVINGYGFELSQTRVTNYVQLHDEAWPSSGGQRLVKTIDTTFPHDDIFARGRMKLAEGIVMCAPGVPAMLMGDEWLEDTGFGTGFADRIDWSKKTTYAGVYAYFRDLVTLRRTNPALRSDAYHVVFHENEGGNLLAWERSDFAGENLVIVANFANVDRNGYRIGVPQGGEWNEILNSQAAAYGESGPENPNPLIAQAFPYDTYPQSVLLEVPARGLVVLRHGSSLVDTPVVAPERVALRLDVPAPNPAAGPRTIRFALARAGHAKLTVLDAAGRRVATVLDEARGEGMTQVTWDGRDAAGRAVAPGVYFVKLEANGESRTRKMTLVR